jgi:hypothetical protein
MSLSHAIKKYHLHHLANFSATEANSEEWSCLNHNHKEQDDFWKSTNCDITTNFSGFYEHSFSDGCLVIKVYFSLPHTTPSTISLGASPRSAYEKGFALTRHRWQRYEKTHVQSYNHFDVISKSLSWPYQTFHCDFKIRFSNWLFGKSRYTVICKLP